MSFTVNYRTSNDDFDTMHMMLLDEARNTDMAISIAKDRAKANGYEIKFESVNRFTCNPDYSEGEIEGYHRVHNVLDDKARLVITSVSPQSPSRNEHGEIIGEVQYIELTVGDLCSKLELHQLIHQLFYYPNQINSPHDCTGKAFVALCDTYTQHDPFNESRNAVVVLHWMRDI